MQEFDRNRLPAVADGAFYRQAPAPGVATDVGCHLGDFSTVVDRRFGLVPFGVDSVPGVGRAG